MEKRYNVLTEALRKMDLDQLLLSFALVGFVAMDVYFGVVF